MSQLIQPVIKKNPEFFILKVRTNDATNNDWRTIVEVVLLLKSAILKSLSDCRVTVPKKILRNDNGKAALTIQNLNKHLASLEIACMEKDSSNNRYLGKEGLFKHEREK